MGAPLLPKTAPFTPEQIAALNHVMAGSTAEQRSWLSGFLAGLQAANSAAVAAPAAVPQVKIPLTILYATESGNAEGLAADAKKAAAKLGFAATILDMADADPVALAKSKNLLVIASTWGQGDPPERAASFYEALMGNDALRLDGVRFAVLALGDSAYVHFCAVGRRIDERLAALGAERIAERIECDLAYEKPAASWLGATLESWKAKAAPDGTGGAVIHVDFAAPAGDAPSPYGKANPFRAEILERVNLNGSRSAKETLHVELSLEGSGLAYEPGDALGIVPTNDPAMAEAILDLVGLGGRDDVRERLLREFDITTLTRPVVEAFARLTGETRVAALLEGDALVAWQEGRQIVDLLEAFPTALTAEQLTGLLRPLPPRLYSIASSLKAHPDQAHLLIGAVRYRSHGRDRKGVTSGFVADQVAAGDTLPVYVKPNKHFRLPSDPGTPIVMIGPGTGVAPFRAFAQEREAVGARGGSWLFFGDRTYTHDFLYQLDWQDHLKNGGLTRIDVAFSRDQPEKVYVQHRLWEQRADLHAWIEDGAHIYVCGDEKHMAKDVHAMLARIVSDRTGRDAEAAEQFLADLRRQGRYQRDVY